MLDQTKVYEYFNFESVTEPIHIIGCGSIGSHLCELFARQGVEAVHLWDFDTVSAHNLTNQMFIQSDIGELKVTSAAKMMHRINPDIKVYCHPEGLRAPYTLAGYLFLCVDSIELRKEIVSANQYNPTTKAFFDFRTRLTDAQHYAAAREDSDAVKSLLMSMDFTHEEAKDATPMSACGVTLNVCDVCKVITSVGFANFRNYVKTNKLKKIAFIDMTNMLFDAI